MSRMKDTLTKPAMWLALTGWAATTALSGCGAEVASTSTGVAATQAAQASQAQAQQAKIVEGFKQAQDAGVSRAASAAD